MKKEQQTFVSVIKQFEYHFDLHTVFDDFLTMSICTMGYNPQTRKSYDEELYIETIEKYKDSELRFNFPKLYGLLVTEMTDRFDSGEGYDVLGEFYESNLARKGASQFFTPWPICMFMAKSTAEQVIQNNEETTRPLRIIDPACGSGRMLLASQKCNGSTHEYYGIDIDHTCVKMTALNMFLSGMFRSEALCANALVPEDFKVSYYTSFLPFGLFRVHDKEKSRLWHLLKNSWEIKKDDRNDYDGTTTKYPDGSQLTIF